jgi:HD-like signal output (HDOD) protein
MPAGAPCTGDANGLRRQTAHWRTILPELQRFFVNAAALPTMPEVAHRLLLTFDRADLRMAEVADLIAKDQGLSVKLLRMANSARYSPRETVTTISDAAHAIGLNSLRDLALSACVAGAFPVIEGFDRLRFWRQCLATAGHARLLAGACGLDADTAYLAGMVLRTGELLMLMVEPDAVALTELRAQAPDSLMDHQRSVMRCTHAEVTAELARRWRFPKLLVDGLRAAADPMACHPFSRLGGVLRLASVMSDAGERGLPAVGTLLETQGDLVEHLHLDLDWLASHLAPHAALTAGVDQLLH